jgi:hypothetical protein
MIVLWANRLHHQARSAGLKSLKRLNIRHLAWHHSLLVCALSVLQCYIARGKERGILVIIIIMFLMNASSPVGTIRWFLVNFRPGYRRAIMAATDESKARPGARGGFLYLRRVVLFHPRRLPSHNVPRSHSLATPRSCRNPSTSHEPSLGRRAPIFDPPGKLRLEHDWQSRAYADRVCTLLCGPLDRRPFRAGPTLGL